MTLRPRSVRMRLTLWYAAAVASVVLVFSLGVYAFVRARLLRQVDQQLRGDLALIEKTIPQGSYEIAELEEHASVLLFQIVQGERVVHQTEGWLRAGLSSALPAGRSGQSWPWKSPSGRHYYVRSAPVVAEGQVFQISAAQDGETTWQTVASLAKILFLGFPGALVLAGVGGYFLSARLLAPVGSMAAKAREITAERLSERLPIENPHDEFGQLAAAFNSAFERLQDSFERLRRFTADASHELRTPLTAIRSVGEVALQDSLEAAAYRDVIGSMLEETDRLTRLVESLLTLTRADAGRIQLLREPIDLASLARDVTECLRVLAEEKEQTLSVEGAAGISVGVDRNTIRQALLNLLDNAIKYTPAGGRIKLAVKRASGGEAVIEVRDDGPGIPPEHRDKIFDRFYRIDKGRSSEKGGAGLGLAITQWAIEANGGKIELESEGSRGSTFRVIFPAALAGANQHDGR